MCQLWRQQEAATASFLQMQHCRHPLCGHRSVWGHGVVYLRRDWESFGQVLNSQVILGMPLSEHWVGLSVYVLHPHQMPAVFHNIVLLLCVV